MNTITMINRFRYGLLFLLFIDTFSSPSILSHLSGVGVMQNRKSVKGLDFCLGPKEEKFS